MFVCVLGVRRLLIFSSVGVCTCVCRCVYVVYVCRSVGVCTCVRVDDPEKYYQSWSNWLFHLVSFNIPYGIFDNVSH